MPRRSAESLAIAPVIDLGRVRLAARPDLSPNVRRVFNELVGSVDASHFRESDRPILEELAQAVALQREATAALADQGLMVGGEVNGLAKVIAVQSRLIASLATRCRLTPQARASKDKAANTTNLPQFDGPPPWERRAPRPWHDTEDTDA